jgi:hypothetical protein
VHGDAATPPGIGLVKNSQAKVPSLRRHDGGRQLAAVGPGGVEAVGVSVATFTAREKLTCGRWVTPTSLLPSAGVRPTT